MNQADKSLDIKRHIIQERHDAGFILAGIHTERTLPIKITIVGYDRLGLAHYV